LSDKSDLPSGRSLWVATRPRFGLDKFAKLKYRFVTTDYSVPQLVSNRHILPFDVQLRGW
jgi:hypothetical protein